MRDTFAQTMTELAREREDICLLSGDIGNRMFDTFKEVAPDRFINCGIAEANMMSMAAGMALSGLRPVVYTITPFTTTRCLEQIKIGGCYHKANIVIVGTGSGLSYGELGATHHSVEDIAILRSLPDIQINAPADAVELVVHLRQALSRQGPSYLRIGKKGEHVIHRNAEVLGIGRASLLKEGKDVLVLGIGPIITEALKASERLKEEGISVGVASMGSVKPIDEEFLKRMLSRGYSSWVTLEEHYRKGGLGSEVVEWLSDRGPSKIKVCRLGISDKFIHKLGGQEYMRKNQGIDSTGIEKTLRSLL